MSRRTAHILAWLLAFATCAVMLTILEVADNALWSAIPVAVAGTPILAFEIWRSRRFPEQRCQQPGLPR